MDARILVSLNTLAFIAVIFVNYLANALPLNGMQTGQISALYPNYFVPAGFTFAIWGVIYALMALFVFRSLWMLKVKKSQALNEISKLSGCFILSCVANISWIFAWHYREIFMSLGAMLVLLYSLMKAYLWIHQERSILFGNVFFSVYLGWISVATIANFTVYLQDNGWAEKFDQPEIWSAVMIVIAFLLAAYMMFRLKDMIFPLVILWAVFGIYKNVSDSEYQMHSSMVSNVAISVVLLLFVLWLGSLWKFYRISNSA